MRKIGKGLLSAALLFAMILCTVITVQAAAPGAPTIESALQTGYDTVTVTWTKCQGAKGYYLEYRIKGTAWKKTRTKKTTLTIGSLEKGKKYQFRVRAYIKANGSKVYGSYSAVKKVKLKEVPDTPASTTKGYSIKTGNTIVYSDPSLKKPSGVIPDTAEITIHTVTGTYAYVEYPVNGGTKSGYIPVSAILTKQEGTTVTAKARVAAYRRPGGASYGHVEVNDSVLILGTKDNYTQVKLPVSGGYRYAFIKSSDVDVMKQEKTKKKLSEALYKNSSASIICGFDGYKDDIEGRHEGIDIHLKEGSPVFALADGEVIRVANGASGSGTLSTVAVYNKDYNKTVLYLHVNPESVFAGKKITTGDRIGTEGWRGLSSESNSHTHVEVRNGKEDHAAKSVNDNKLENEDPAPFWNSLGYIVK